MNKIQSSNPSLPLDVSKRDIAHLAAAISVVVLIGGILSLVAIHHHNLGPLNALSQLTKGGAGSLIAASAVVLGAYLIWTRFFKKEVVTLKNKNGNKISYIRPGSKKWMRKRLLKMNSIDQPPSAKIQDPKKAFLNPRKPEQLNKNEEDLTHLWNVCEEKGLLEELYFEIVSHPSSYLLLTPAVLGSPYARIIPLDLDECACVTSTFNRLAPREENRRKHLERAILTHVETEVAYKSQPIKFIDMGTGNFLQLWLLIGLFKKKGWRKFEVKAVDPKLNQEKLNAFTEFFKQFPDVELTIEAVQSIHEVKEKNFKPHFVSAIDFDDFDAAKKDLATALQFLDEKGKLFFGGGARDFVMSQDKIHILKQDGHCKKMGMDISSKTLTQNCRIQVEDGLWLPLIEAFSALQDKGVTSIEICNTTKEDGVEEILSELFPTLTLTFMDSLDQQPDFVLTETSPNIPSAKTTYVFKHELIILRGNGANLV